MKLAKAARSELKTLYFKVITNGSYFEGKREN